MAEPDYHLLVSEAVYSTTSTTFVTPTGKEILGTALTGSTNYVAIVSGGHGTNNVNSSSNRMAVSDDGGTTEMTGSLQRAELRSSSDLYPEHYYFIGKYQTAASPSDFELRLRCNGTDSAKSMDTHMLLWNLDELGAHNYQFDEDNTNYPNVTSATSTAASVTIGDGNSDWLVFYCTTWSHDTANDDVRFWIEDGASTEYGSLRFEVEDVNEVRCYGGVVAFEGIASTTFTVRLQGYDAQASDCNRAAIFALRLDAFEDHFIQYDTSTSQTQIAATATVYTVTTATHTTATGGSVDWLMGCNGIYNVQSDAFKTPVDRLADTTLGEIVGGTTVGWSYNGALATPNATRFNTLASVADSTALDIDYEVQDPFDATPAYGASEALIWGFTLRYRQPFQEIYLSRRPNTLLRM